MLDGNSKPFCFGSRVLLKLFVYFNQHSTSSISPHSFSGFFPPSFLVESFHSVLCFSAIIISHSPRVLMLHNSCDTSHVETQWMNPSWFPWGSERGHHTHTHTWCHYYRKSRVILPYDRKHVLNKLLPLRLASVLDCSRVGFDLGEVTPADFWRGHSKATLFSPTWLKIWRMTALETSLCCCLSHFKRFLDAGRCFPYEPLSRRYYSFTSFNAGEKNPTTFTCN